MTGGRVVALSGGIGGAKLAFGLARAMDPDRLTVAANPGDDFEHLGLTVCPDLDTLIYTLAGLADRGRGWGRNGETWTFMAVLESLGGEAWFKLGDGDLALHVERSRRLTTGEPLADIMADVARRWGIRSRVRPATGDRLRTVVDTADGPMPFQHYFVRDACRPRVTGFRFDGADTARPDPEILDALGDNDLRAVVICPSNPFLSVDPMLAMPAFRQALADCRAPVVAVSPIVGGRAIKGPAAKIMEELGLPVSARSVWRHYGALIDGIVLDEADAGLVAAAGADGVTALVAPTIMRSDAARVALAKAVLTFADGLEALT